MTANDLRARLKRAIVATPAVTALLAFSTSSPAANSYWDGDGQGVVAGGSGQWDNTLARWSPSPSGSSYAAFNSADDAIFGGGGGVVYLPAGVTANSVSVAASGRYFFVGPQTGPAPITLSSGVFDTGAQTVYVDQPLAGAAGLTKNGAGTLLFATVNTYTGATTINGGTLALASNVADIPDASAVVVNAGATLDLGSTGGFNGDAVGSIAGAGNINFGAATFQGYGEITGSSLTAGGDDSSTTFSGNLLGAGGAITKTGAGTLTLSGSNTFTGGLRITGGAVTLASASAIAPTCPVILTGTATLNLASPTTIGGLGTSAGTQTVNNNGNTLTVGASNLNFQANAVIAGAGGLVKIGSGVQQLTTVGSPSTFSGGTSLRGGILVVSGDSKLGALSGNVTFDGGTLSNFVSAATPAVNITSNRTFILNSATSGFQVFSSGGTATLASITLGGAGGGGKVTGSGTLIKSGPGVLAMNNGTDDFSGGIVLEEGVVESQQNAANGMPFGTGSIDIRRGRLFVHPGGGSTGANITVRAASDPGATLTYAAGSEIKVDRTTTGASWNLVKFDIGPSGAALDAVLHRAPGGTLVFTQRTPLSNFGTTNAGSENVVIEGGVSTKNGIVSPSIMATSSTTTNPDFLGYGANGFIRATYTASDINASNNTSVTNLLTPQTLTADRAAYALKTNSPISGPFNLTVGDGTGAAALIMVLSSASISTNTLVFDGTDAVIYAQRTSGDGTAQSPFPISAPMSITGGGGLSKIGTGFIQLNAVAGYSGATRIGQGGIQLGVNDALPTTTDLILTGAVPETVSFFALEQSTFKLGVFNQTVNSLASENQYAQVDLSTGTLTVNQSATTTFRGTFTGAGGTLVKSGSGTLILNPYKGGSFANTSGPFVSTYGKLKITGGTVAVSSFNSLPANPASPTPDTITLDNGGTLRFDFSPIFTGVIDNATASMSFSADTSGPISPNRNVTLGAGGGTIAVSDPRALIIWQRGNGETLGTDDLPVLNGLGDLTKDGPGTLRLGIGNLNTGRVIIKAGTLQFQNESALGDLSGVGFRADGLKLDGGVAQSNGTGVLSANRGLTVTSNGGALKGNFVLNAPIAGSGTLDQIRVDRSTASNVTLNVASPDFSGTLHLTDGVTTFNASGCAGTGTIDVQPLFPVTLNKAAGSQTVLNNPINLGAGAAISVRVEPNFYGLVLNGKISGGNDLFKNGSGAVVVGNSANDYSGETIIQCGTLEVSANNALGATSGGTRILSSGLLGFRSSVNYTAPEPVTLIGGALFNDTGNNTFAGAVSLAADSAVLFESGSLKLSAGISGAATLTKSGSNLSNLEVRNLRINGLIASSGKIIITPDSGPAGVSRIGTMSLAGRLDITNNKLITADPVGTWNGSTYTGTTGLIRSGRNGGGWGGSSGIITSQSSATAGNFTSIGVASAAQVKSIAVTATAVFAGQTVTGSDTLVMYTYGGDANLDGKINVDDYGHIDSSIPIGLSGWFNGDFNYDGKINVDDYGIIDFNISIQGAPFSTSIAATPRVAGLAEVTGVPEPATVLGLTVAGMMFLPRAPPPCLNVTTGTFYR